MQPISVSVDVPGRSPDEVYAFLDVMANHEQFTDHMMRDWRFSGPPSGIGSRASVTAVLGGRREPVEIEVVRASPPTLNVERNVSAAGKRVANGTYRLAPAQDGGTTVTFEYAWERAPRLEELTAPLVRAVMRRGLQTSMRRLAETLNGA